MLGPTPRVDELHLLNGVAGDFEETRARKGDGQATGTANGDVKVLRTVMPIRQVGKGRNSPHSGSLARQFRGRQRASCA
jgi:hypothetical protein